MAKRALRTNRTLWALIIIACAIILVPEVAATWYCEINQTCSPGYVSVMAVEKNEDNWTHAGINWSSPNQVCCPTPINTSCLSDYANVYLRFSNLSNAHVQTTDYGNYLYPLGTENLCVDKYVIYLQGNETCHLYPFSNFIGGTVCLFALNKDTNSHVLDCAIAGSDSSLTKVCLQDRANCEIVNATISPLDCTGNCTVGNRINITYNYRNSDCYAPSFFNRTAILVEASSGDGSCKVGVWNPSADIRGMDVGYYPEEPIILNSGFAISSYQANWTIPSFGDVCAGKTIFPRRAYIVAWRNTSGLILAIAEQSLPSKLFGNFTLSDIRITMKCGNVSIHGTTTFNSSCTVPPATVPPSTVCYADGCTINETGSSAQCYHFGDTINNLNNASITCSYNNTWCPTQFFFNMTTGICELNLTTCDEGYYPNRISPVPAYNLTCYDMPNMLNNPLKCFYTATAPYSQSCCNIQKWDEYYFCQQAQITIY